MPTEPSECSAYISRAIKDQAAKRGMSIERLSDFAGVSRSGMWAILASERLPSVDWLLKVANALEVRPRSLLP